MRKFTINKIKIEIIKPHIIWKHLDKKVYQQIKLETTIKLHIIWE